MATATARRRRAIEHLVATDLARDRLARAAFEAVADGLDLGPAAIRTGADRAWVQVAIAGPIQHAAELALEGLVDDLVRALTGGEPALVARMLAASQDMEAADPVTLSRRDGMRPPPVAADRPAERTLTAIVG